MSFFKKIKDKFYFKDIKTLLLIDILYMKDINAIYGFKNGNYIIYQLHKLLKKEIKLHIRNRISKNVSFAIQNTYIDVFSLTIYDDLSYKEITSLKTYLYNKISKHKFNLFSKEKISINTTMGCSKGVSENLIVFAEKALYNAKKSYLPFTYYDSSLHDDSNYVKNFVSILNYNIKNRLVEPYFQKIVDTQTKEVIKYEALMRIFDKNGTIMLPGSFLQKSKKYRLYTKMMLILIEKVFIYIQEHKINVSINLEFNDILNPLITQNIITKLEDSNLGKFLTIEILEREKISNFDIVNSFISDLKRYSVKVAIDDFGSGFSNYEYILNINVDYIKIDGSLIKQIDNTMYRNLIKSIVSFSKENNIKLVAEFVSDIKILRFVRSVGIDYSQGYYFNKPQSIKELFEKGQK